MKSGKRSPEEREKRELERAINALQAQGHNPIEWAAIVRFVAPIIARIAARYVMKVISRKLDKRISSKVREETVVQAADYLADIAIKRTSKKSGK